MSPAPPSRISERERTVLLAMSMALAALGIDLILPAFAAIRADLGLESTSTAVAGLITAYFIGMAIGQMIYGPVSDAVGRKPMLLLSYAVYAVGAIATAVAPDLAWVLAARVLWGLGAAGPRALTMAIIRDRYRGAAMSRAMSLITAIFILVPVVAPGVGTALLLVMSWRAVSVLCAVLTVAMAAWTMRLAESLAPEHRRPVRLPALRRATRMVVTTRPTLASMLSMIFLYGAFTSYLASSEIIIGDVFGLADAFPFVFGAIALLIGAGMRLNAGLVERLGTDVLVRRSSAGFVAGSAGMVGVALATGGRPAFGLFVVPLAVALVSHAVLFPNLNAVAMEPMGEVAGLASSVIGATQVALGAVLGAVLDAAFDGTVIPLSLGFLGYGIPAAALAVLSLTRGRQAVARQGVAV